MATKPEFNDDGYIHEETFFGTWRTWLLNKLSLIADYTETLMSEHTETHAPSDAEANPTSVDTTEHGHSTEIATATNTLKGSVATAGDTLAKLYALIGNVQALIVSDDLTLDTVQELVNYIKANKNLIDSVTTNKVNVSDIINNLTSTDTDKPLSAAQGKALKTLIDNVGPGDSASSVATVYNVVDYGVVLDGATDIVDAVYAAINAIDKTKPAILYFPAGAYMKGDGTSTSYIDDGSNWVDGQNFAIGKVNRFEFDNFNDLTIIGYGAIITEHPQNSIINNNGGFKFHNCDNLKISGLEYDGNLLARSDLYPFTYTDMSAYNQHSGLHMTSCTNVDLLDLKMHHCTMDGFMVGRGYVDAVWKWTEHITMTRCDFDYNYRQGMSIVGANHGTVSDCKFSNTARTYSELKDAEVGTSPRAGMDSETWAGNEHWTFDKKTIFQNNAGFTNCNDGALYHTFNDCIWVDDGIYSETPSSGTRTYGNIIKNSTFLNSKYTIHNNGFDCHDNEFRYNSDLKDERGIRITHTGGEDLLELGRSGLARFDNNTVIVEQSVEMQALQYLAGRIYITIPNLKVDNNQFINLRHPSGGTMVQITKEVESFTNNRISYDYDITDMAIGVLLIEARNRIGNTSDDRYVMYTGLALNNRVIPINMNSKSIMKQGLILDANKEQEIKLFLNEGISDDVYHDVKIELASETRPDDYKQASLLNYSITRFTYLKFYEGALSMRHCVDQFAQAGSAFPFVSAPYVTVDNYIAVMVTSRCVNRICVSIKADVKIFGGTLKDEDLLFGERTLSLTPLLINKWASNKAYIIGNQVRTYPDNYVGLYECTVAGTSSNRATSSMPAFDPTVEATTDESNTGGTVTWKCVNPEYGDVDIDPSYTAQ